MKSFLNFAGGKKMLVLKSCTNLNHALRVYENIFKIRSIGFITYVRTIVLLISNINYDHIGAVNIGNTKNNNFTSKPSNLFIAGVNLDRTFMIDQAIILIYIQKKHFIFIVCQTSFIKEVATTV